MKNILLTAIILISTSLLFSQESYPDAVHRVSGYRTESYNLRTSYSATIGASASASYEISTPQSSFILISDQIASFSFQNSATPLSSSTWEALPASFALEQKYEAAAGSYIWIRAGSAPVTFHFYSIGR